MIFLCTPIFGGNILYISYSGKNREYATVARSRREGKRVIHEYIYLGKVIDREAGIYENRDMGTFTFDPTQCHYGVPKEEPKSVIAVKQEEVFRRRMVDFGDCYFLNEFLYKSGLMSIVDKIEYKNHDTLHTMILFYSLSSLANCDAIHWYSGNIVHLLYPNANITSQRISEFLSEIGSPENRMIFQEAYIKFITENYSNDKNILIDSTGLPNSINFPLTCINVHNGKLSNEIRLIFVIQKSTGLPIFYYTIPGNIVDVSTLKRIFIHLEELNIDVESCILDAGYYSDKNIDLFYNDNHDIKIGFIIRVKSNCKILKQMIKDELSTLEQKDNFVKYEDRYLFIKKQKVKVGTNNNDAWLYLGLDRARMYDEYKSLVKRARKNNISNEDVFNALQTEGLFGILSNKDYSCEEILPAYYQRQSAEQIFDFGKNYTKLLPIRTYTEETFQGHLLLSYIASCAVKLIQIKLQVTNLYFGSRLSFMRNQKCIIYKRCIVTDPPQKEANDTYKCFDIYCPESIKFQDGKLLYTPSSINVQSILPTKESQNVNISGDISSPNSSHISKTLKNPTPSESTTNCSEISTSSNTSNQAEDNVNVSSTKRGRGRPKGSKNKKTIEREAAMASQPQPEKRGRGRPKGSKNKKTIEREAVMTNQPQPEKRGRGRPKGSKNKKNMKSAEGQRS